ncbi:MAG: DDE-type integrase/transposase/recombinase [Candidatus Micrarchaeota archaeon]
MAKLNKRKINWIMKQLREGIMSIRQIARMQKVSPRRIRQLREYKSNTGRAFCLSAKRKQRSTPLTPDEIDLVLLLRRNYHVGATFLEKILKKQGTPLPHNKIQDILNTYGMAKPLKKKVKRKAWVRWERKHSNSLCHTDWTKLGDKWLIAYEDDASRFIVGYGLFDSPTTENSLKVLRGAIMAHGKPKAMLTGHDSQFFSNASEKIQKGPTKFERFLEANKIKHIVGGVNHPQTNGKLERFFGTVKSKLDEFESLDELMHWYNYIKPHMSLDFDELETPAQAFERKMHHKVKSSNKQVAIAEVD